MERYSKLQIWLHWIVFILVAFQYAFYEPIAQAFDLRLEGKNYNQSAFIPLHLTFGGLIFLLVTVRIWVRLDHGVPDHPNEKAVLLNLISKAVHWSFYVSLLLLPITGGAAWFQLSVNAGNAHEILRGGLLLLIFVHLGASLFHYFILKSNLFKRMWW